MEKTMTQTDTQVKEKNKIEAQTETKTESRADAQENEYVWKNGHPTEEEVLCQSSCILLDSSQIPQRSKYCASPVVIAFFDFLIIFANSVELN